MAVVEQTLPSARLFEVHKAAQAKCGWARLRQFHLPSKATEGTGPARRVQTTRIQAWNQSTDATKERVPANRG